jgi:hypothetical protein
MIRLVAPGLYVGDFTALAQFHRLCEAPSRASILHATKTSHRAYVGYSTYACPKDSPEYLFTQRGNDMALNMVDGVRPNNVMVQAGLRFLHREAAKGRTLLIHCDKGQSRSPMLAMLYLSTLHPTDNFERDYPLAKHYMQTMYPEMNMHPLLERFLMENWSMKYDL